MTVLRTIEAGELELGGETIRVRTRVVDPGDSPPESCYIVYLGEGSWVLHLGMRRQQCDSYSQAEEVAKSLLPEGGRFCVAVTEGLLTSEGVTSQEITVSEEEFFDPVPELVDQDGEELPGGLPEEDSEELSEDDSSEEIPEGAILDEDPEELPEEDLEEDRVERLPDLEESFDPEDGDEVVVVWPDDAVDRGTVVDHTKRTMEVGFDDGDDERMEFTRRGDGSWVEKGEPRDDGPKAFLTRS